MSIRRSISFNKNEQDLLDSFDDKGKSDFAKEAMRFFIKNKDKLIIDSLKELVPLISSTTNTNNNTNHRITEHKEAPRVANKLIR